MTKTTPLFLPPVAYLLVAVLLLFCSAEVGAHPGLDEEAHAIDAALAKEPDSAQLQIRRAVVHRESEQWDQAVAGFLKAADLGADHEMVDLEVASALLEADMPDTAAVFVGRVLKHHPDNAHALVLRARSRQARDRGDEAADDFRRAAELATEPTPAFVLEAMQAHTALSHHREALAIADDAMRKMGVLVSIQFPAIDSELALQNYDGALARIDALLKTSPRHELWMARKGDILSKAGRSSQARSLYVETRKLISGRTPERRGVRIRELDTELQGKIDNLTDSESSAPKEPSDE